jgi:transposase-like protein
MHPSLQYPIFQSDKKARQWLEARVWPAGPVCPHCGTWAPEKITSLKGKAHRPGVYQCNECREQFTVTVGTVFERSKIPLTKWLAALFLLAASKKGVSAHQIHRSLDISYKSAWFLMHRLREAMRTGGLAPLGGAGKVVEADEIYYGKAETHHVSPQRKGRAYTKRGKYANNRPIVALVQSGGNVRSFHVPVADQATVGKIVVDNIAKESRLHTDESRLYLFAQHYLGKHETVTHSRGEYVRDDIHTNTIENYSSVFKRGMKGVYQHCKEKHLHRYLAKFDFRYNNRAALGVNDNERAEILDANIKGAPHLPTA